jgi:hypothetical protein
MESKLIVFLVLLALASEVAAWSDYADTYFCDSAVDAVWGAGVVTQCLDAYKTTDQGTICALYGSKKAECSDLNEATSPALLPNLLGESELEQAGQCPMPRGVEADNLCAKKNDALDRAYYWLGEAAKADTTCGRVQMFCVAGNYLAQAYNPFNRVLFEDEECKSVVYRKVDFALASNQTTWGANSVCVFNYNMPMGGGVIPKNYSTVVQFNERTLTGVVANLTAEARALKNKPFPKKPTTTTTTLPANATKTENKSCVNDSGCKTGEVCANSNCVAAVSSTTTTTTPTTTTLYVPTTTLAPTTTAPTTTVPAPTTTTIPEQKSSSNWIFYLAGVLLLVAAAAYLLPAILQSGEKPADDGPRRGLRGLSGKESRIESYGSSRLAEADRTPRDKKLVPLKERDTKEERREHVPEPPPRKEDNANDKRRHKSVLQPQEKEGSSLGRR